MALYVSVLKDIICPKESAVQNRLGKEIRLSSFHTEKNEGTVMVTFPKSCGKSVRMEPISIKYQCNSLSTQRLRKKSRRALY